MSTQFDYLAIYISAYSHRNNLHRFIKFFIKADATITEQAKDILHTLHEEIESGEVDLISGSYFEKDGPSEISRCVLGWLFSYKGIDADVLMSTRFNGQKIKTLLTRTGSIPDTVTVTLKNLADMGFSRYALRFLQQANDTKTGGPVVFLHEGGSRDYNRGIASDPSQRVLKAIEMLIDDETRERYLEAIESAGYDVEEIQSEVME